MSKPLEHLAHELVGQRAGRGDPPLGVGEGHGVGHAHREGELAPGGLDLAQADLGCWLGRSRVTDDTTAIRKSASAGGLRRLGRRSDGAAGSDGPELGCDG